MISPHLVVTAASRPITPHSLTTTTIDRSLFHLPLNPTYTPWLFTTYRQGGHTSDSPTRYRLQYHTIRAYTGVNERATSRVLTTYRGTGDGHRKKVCDRRLQMLGVLDAEVSTRYRLSML